MSHNPSADESVYSVRELEPLLQRKFGNALKMIDYKVENLVPPGENFGSNAYSIIVKVQKTADSTTEELIHCVGKTIYLGVKELDWTVSISKEIYMYTEIIETYASEEEENNIEDKDNIRNFFPSIYAYRLSLDTKKDEVDEDALILLENMEIHGYYVLDKKIGLDFIHASEALKALAKFHAAGIAIKNKYPSKFEKFIEQADKIVLTIDNDLYERWYKNFLNAAAKLSSRGKYVDCVKKILARHKMEGMWLICSFVRDDLWSTIAHNDFSTNNIMFRKNESTGKIDGVKIIDFQAYCYTNLCADICYFISTSLDDDTKQNRIDDLLEVYYENLILALESLKVDVTVYSKEKFDDQLKKDAWWELFHCAMALSFLTSERGNDEDKASQLNKIQSYEGGDLLSKKLNDFFEIYEQNGWWLN